MVPRSLCDWTSPYERFMIVGMPDVHMTCIIVKASVSQVSSLTGNGQSVTTLKLFGRASS